MRQQIKLVTEVYDENTHVHILWTPCGFRLPVLNRHYIRGSLLQYPNLLELVTLQEYGFKESDEPR